MKFSILLFVLGQILRVASVASRGFKKHIGQTSARILIKTADGRRARLFIFEKGKVRSVSGDHKEFDVALVWKDAKTGFSVMTDNRSDSSFNAAAEGRLKVLGMSVYAQWFEDAIKLVV